LIPSEGNLKSAWERLFGGESTEDPVAHAIYGSRRSMLDFVGEQFQGRLSQVSKLDQNKLETHRALIRDLESRIAALEDRVCVPPAYSELSAGSDSLYGVSKKYREVGQAQAKLIRAAFACDMSRVVHVHIGNGQTTGDFIDAPAHEIHSDLAHSVDTDEFAKEKMTAFGRYNAQIVADLATELDAETESDGSTVLDNTVILWTGDIASGVHDFGPMPYVLVGGGNGMINAGRYVHYGATQRLPNGKMLVRNAGEGHLPTSFIGAAHNQLLVGLCQAMGLSDVNWVGQEKLLGELDVTGPLRHLR